MAHGIANTYTTIVRGVPELILLLLVYYGTPTLIQRVLTSMGRDVVIDINPFIAGVATLGFIYGAFATEVSIFDLGTYAGAWGLTVLVIVLVVLVSTFRFFDGRGGRTETPSTSATARRAGAG